MVERSLNQQLGQLNQTQLTQQFRQQTQQLQKYLSQWDTRLRLSQLSLWIPRGILVGIIVGLLLTIIAWLRPFLFPTQLAIVSGATIVTGILVAIVGVMLWPRSIIQKARYFDQLFDLKERNSAALELTNGKINASRQLLEHQINDALDYSSRVKVNEHLRPHWRRWELIALLVLGTMLVLGIVLNNPQNSVLTAQAAVNAAITKQVDQLEQLKQGIEKNSNLTEQEKKQLNQIIQETIDQLKQPNITQPEAVAALSQAQQKLNNASQQFTPQQDQALKGAANALDESQSTEAVGQKLGKGDLAGASQELNNLAKRAGDGQLTDQQRNETADALDKAAQDLASINPEAASALKDAADALRRGDKQGAQNALQKAANALQQQQQQMQQSAMAQAGQSAAQQMQQGQNQVAQAGQQGQQNQQSSQNNQNSQNSQQGQQGQNQQGNAQSGNSSNSQVNSQNPQFNNKSGQQNQQGAPSTGQQNGQQQGNQVQPQSGANQQNQQSSQQGQQSNGQQNGRQQGQQGNQNQQGNQSQSGNGQQDGGPSNGKISPGNNGQSGAQSGQGGSSNPNGQSAQGQGADQSGGNGAGQGAGGKGNDITSGSPNGSADFSNLNNGHGDGTTKSSDNEGVYAPSFIGGSGGQKLQPKGDSSNNSGDPVEQGNFSNNPSGESVVPLSSVADAAASEAGRAMDANQVPGALRGVIRDYFTGLQSK